MAKKQPYKKSVEKETSVDKFKIFVLKYWIFIVGVIAIILISYSAYYGYNHFKEKKLAQASLKYFEFESELREGSLKGDVDEEGLEELIEEMNDDYSGTIYPAMAQYQLGNYYFAVGNLTKSHDTFEKCLKNSNDDDLTVSAKWGVGDCYYAKEEYGKAIEVYSEIYDEHPENDVIAFILLRLSYAYMEIDKPEDTFKYTNIIITSYPTSSVVPEARELRDFVDTY